MHTADKVAFAEGQGRSSQATHSAICAISQQTIMPLITMHNRLDGQQRYYLAMPALNGCTHGLTYVHCLGFLG